MAFWRCCCCRRLACACSWHPPSAVPCTPAILPPCPAAFPACLAAVASGSTIVYTCPAPTSGFSLALKAVSDAAGCGGSGSATGTVSLSTCQDPPTLQCVKPCISVAAPPTDGFCAGEAFRQLFFAVSSAQPMAITVESGSVACTADKSTNGEAMTAFKAKPFLFQQVQAAICLPPIAHLDRMPALSMLCVGWCFAFQ